MSEDPSRWCLKFDEADGLVTIANEDPNGKWIYDPDHKIDLRNITSQSSGRGEAWFCSTCKHDENYGEFCESCGEPRR